MAGGPHLTYRQHRVPHLRDGLIVDKVGHFSRQRKKSRYSKPAHAASTNLVQSVESSFINGSGAEARTGFPKWESLKNKVGKVGVFFDREKVSTHHDLPSFHHVLTIKKPRSVHLFLQNLPQKRGKPCQKKILQKITDKKVTSASGEKAQEAAERVSCWAVRSSWMPFSA